MQHSVPQFIDIEDKLFGPLSFRQAIYLAGGIGAGWSIYVILSKISTFIPFIFKVVLAMPPVALGAALAFVKINNRNFIFYLQSFFRFQLGAKKFVWKKNNNKKIVDRVHNKGEVNNPVNVEEDYVPKVTRSKIKNLALNLDMELDEKLSNFGVNTIK